MSRLLRLALLLVVMSLVPGCHTLYIQVAEGVPTHAVRDKQQYFLWGLTPQKEIDVGERCPGSTMVAIREDTTADDVLGAVVTLGVWTPRTTWYYCAGEDS